MLGSFPSTGCQPAGRATSTSASDTWNGRRRDEDTKSLPTVEARRGRNSSCKKRCQEDGDFVRDVRNRISFTRHDIRPSLPTVEARMRRNYSVEEELPFAREFHCQAPTHEDETMIVFPNLDLCFVGSIIDLIATLRHETTK